MSSRMLNDEELLDSNALSKSSRPEETKKALETLTLETKQHARILETMTSLVIGLCADPKDVRSTGLVEHKSRKKR